MKSSLELYPAFGRDSVVVILSSSDEFSIYLGVCIKSIINMSSTNNKYDILVMERSISDNNKRRINKLAYDRENISIRFVNVKQEMDKYNFFLNSSRLSQETYYGLLIPYMLNNYNKAIIMDCDMIAVRDVAELFFESLDGMIIGGVNDVVLQGWLNDETKDAKNYYTEYLKIKNPYKCFNGGLIVLDFQKYRDYVTKERVAEYINEYKLRVVDQDVFNILLEGKSKLIDVGWNHMIMMEGAIKDAVNNAPDHARKAYYAAQKNPYIIHYAGDFKPWSHPTVEFADEFWKIARETPFYEELLFKLVNKVAIKTVCTHQIIFHGGMIKKILKPHRVERIKNTLKRVLGPGTYKYKIARKICYMLSGRVYSE